jgi:uncharacterized membrane protein
MTQVRAQLEFAWKTFRTHWVGLLLIGAAMAGTQAVAHYALRITGNVALGAVVELALSSLFAAGTFNACRSAALGRSPRLADAITPLWRCPGHALAVTLAVSAGALLAGVGLLITLFLFPFSLLLVCEGESWQQALQHSKRLVLSNPGQVLALLCVLALLHVLGMLLLGVGTLVTTPICVLALIALRLELEVERLAH